MGQNETVSVADSSRLAYVGAPAGKKDRDPNAWFTPQEIVDVVRDVLEIISLDPFSCKEANQVIQAARWIGERENALVADWLLEPGSIFMNPPYSGGMIGPAVDRFLQEIESHLFEEGIVLVNNATETKWFQALLGECQAVCFPNKRIAFYNEDGKRVSGNTRGQALFYFGDRIVRFRRLTASLGPTVFS